MNYEVLPVTLILFLNRALTSQLPNIHVLAYMWPRITFLQTFSLDFRMQGCFTGVARISEILRKKEPSYEAFNCYLYNKYAGNSRG